MNRLTVVSLVAVVTALMMVQVPLDLRTHRLSRRATIWAATTVAMIVVVDAWLTDALASASSKILATVALVGVYGIVHRVSPQSLGWGDVLLVVPLTLAVAYVSVMSMLWWQIAAATTGAVHAVIVRVRSGCNFVPFGPHLLLTAWAVLVVSV